MFVDKSFGDEDRIVVALAEDEGGQDDVHDVEPDVEQLHEAEDPQPADGHGQEGHEAQFEPPEREPEEEEDDHAARPADVVEVAGQRIGDGTVHPLHVEAVGAGDPLPQGLLDRPDLPGKHLDPIDHRTGSVRLIQIPFEKLPGQRRKLLPPERCERLVEQRFEPGEGILAEPVRPERRSQLRTDRVGLPSDELLPAGQPPQLLGARGEEGCGALQHRPWVLGDDPLQGTAGRFAPLQRPVPGRGLRGHVDRRQAVRAEHPGESLQIGALPVGHVVDVPHVRVEGRVAAEEGEQDGQQADPENQTRLALEVDRRERPEEVLSAAFGPGAFPDQVGQEDQHEEDGADQHEGGEEPQVAQRRGRHRDQAEEGPHGGDVADNERRDDFTQGCTHVVFVAQVGQHVERVIDGDADDDRADAQDDHRHFVAEERHAAHGEEPPEEDRDADQQQRPHGAQRPEQQRKDQHDGHGDRPQAVGLDLPRIRNGDDRSPGKVDLQLGSVGFDGIRGVAQQGDQPGVGVGFV